MTLSGSNTINSKPNAGIRALAEQLSLSVGTISNVFNKPDIVSEKTKKKVLDAAGETGFVPNRHASALRSQRTGLIGVVMSSMENPYYVQVAREAQDAAAACGFETVLANSGYWDTKREAAALQYLSSLRVEGILMIVQAGKTGASHVQALINQGCKVVSMSKTREGIAGESIWNVDSEIGAKEATNYLIELGHKKIGIMDLNPKFSGGNNSNPKLHGAKQAIKEVGLDKEALEIISFGREKLSEAQEVIEKSLKNTNGRPTAILANNDTFALAAYGAAKKLGLSVPKDLSVIGFDNIEVSAFYNPPLTTVSQMHLEPGKQAMNLLIETIENPEQTPQKFEYNPKLIVRQSTAPPRSGGTGVPPVNKNSYKEPRTKWRSHVASGQDNFNINNKYETTNQTSNEAGAITAPEQEVLQEATLASASEF